MLVQDIEESLMVQKILTSARTCIISKQIKWENLILLGLVFISILSCFCGVETSLPYWHQELLIQLTIWEVWRNLKKSILYTDHWASHPSSVTISHYTKYHMPNSFMMVILGKTFLICWSRFIRQINTFKQHKLIYLKLTIMLIVRIFHLGQQTDFRNSSNTQTCSCFLNTSLRIFKMFASPNLHSYLVSILAIETITTNNIRDK